MTKHTPGPWAAWDHGRYRGGSHDPEVVCNVLAGPERKANARLIKASPN